MYSRLAACAGGGTTPAGNDGEASQDAIPTPTPAVQEEEPTEEYITGRFG